MSKKNRENLIITIVAIGILATIAFCGCAAINRVKGFIDPYARSPDQLYQKLCGPEGQVTEMCRDEGQGCEEAELTCDLLAIALDVMEVVK